LVKDCGISARAQFKFYQEQVVHILAAQSATWGSESGQEEGEDGILYEQGTARRRKLPVFCDVFEPLRMREK
jgi:hypothetical protein